MNRFLYSLCLLVLLLTSCNKKEPDKVEYVDKMSYKSTYYSSGFATEGNDYYYINTDKGSKEVSEGPSVPSRYIVDVDARYQSMHYIRIKKAKEAGIESEIPDPVIEKFIVKIYDIGTKELLKTIDVKPLIENCGEDICITAYDFDTTLIEGQPYITIDIADVFHSTTDYNINDYDYRWFCVNLLTGEYIIREREPSGFKKLRYAEVAIFAKRWEFFSINSPGIHYQEKMFVYNMNYWDGCRVIEFYVKEIPINNKKLYSRFPTLKAEVEKLKAEDNNARINLVLTGNPSYEEVASYIVEDGFEPTFDGMRVWDNESIDGQKHTVHSAEEWYKYYKYYKPEELDWSFINPILPREE